MTIGLCHRLRRSCAITSGVSSGSTSIAAKFSATWLGRLAPVITLDTFGFAAHHARHSWASVQPSSSAIGRSRSTLASAVPSDSTLAEPLVAGQRATRVGGDPVLVLARQQAGGERAPDRGAETDVGVQPGVLLLDLVAVEQVVLRLLHDRLVQVVPLGDLPRGTDLVGRPLAGAPVQRLARRR